MIVSLGIDWLACLKWTTEVWKLIHYIVIALVWTLTCPKQALFTCEILKVCDGLTTYHSMSYRLNMADIECSNMKTCWNVEGKTEISNIRQYHISAEHERLTNMKISTWNIRRVESPSSGQSCKSVLRVPATTDAVDLAKFGQVMKDVGWFIPLMLPPPSISRAERRWWSKWDDYTLITLFFFRPP